MRSATLLVLACLALAAGAASAQNITILDQNGQPHEVDPNQFLVVAPHPGIIDTDHLHAQNGVCVFDVNNVFVNDPSLDPNGRGYTDVIVQPGPAFEPKSVVLGFGLMVLKGATDDANMLGFTANAHSGPLDLAVFGFEPSALDGADSGAVHDSSGGR